MNVHTKLASWHNLGLKACATSDSPKCTHALTVPESTLGTNSEQRKQSKLDHCKMYKSTADTITLLFEQKEDFTRIPILSFIISNQAEKGKKLALTNDPSQIWKKIFSIQIVQTKKAVAYIDQNGNNKSNTKKEFNSPK